MTDDSKIDKDAEKPGENASEAVDVGTAIQIQNFELRAGQKTLLREASAEFPAGKLSLVLGCSGVGKSLLMKILAGLISKDDAAIRFDGSIDFLRDGSRSVDESVAVVFQSFALFDELSPKQNIEIAIDHSQNPASSTLAIEQATSLLNDLGVPTDRRTAVLSGGQQQRLAIARALGANSSVVLYLSLIHI